MRVLHEERLPTAAPDIIQGDEARLMCVKRRIALATAKNPMVQREAMFLEDPAEFLDALLDANVVPEVDGQYRVRMSYPSYNGRLAMLARVGSKHTRRECPLAGLNVVLKAFDHFDDQPKDNSIGAYELYVFLTICILRQFFGEYTAKQIARAACQCFAPT